jgi:hypothetical protein
MDISSLQWQSIDADLLEFNPEMTLVPGQSFGWQRLGTERLWVGVVDTYPLIFEQKDTCSCVASLDGRVSGRGLSALVHDYLQLDTNVTALYKMVGNYILTDLLTY